LVEESFKLKKQSEHLLEVAKTAVEIAIEQDEATAIAYIKETTFTAKG
jgi:type I restriction enzyme S subunit/type I restriction enzyme M protein